jgi:carbon storage regulator
MLVLSRKTGDEIVMGHGAIRISVLGISGTRVQLGITAPAGIPVHRQEIHQRIMREAHAAGELEGNPRRVP